MNKLKTFSKLGSALLIILTLIAVSCKTESKPTEQSIEKEVLESSQIEGTWKMTYAEIRENDSVQVKDLSSTDFIKILNKSHFAFFNPDIFVARYTFERTFPSEKTLLPCGMLLE